jgi:predicted DCC family thiol-disulfide oxidoreductase YuxK
LIDKSQVRIVFYDGDCGFCSGTVRWLIRVDSKRVLRYSPTASELYRAMVADPGIDSVVYAQVASDQVFRAWFYSDAVIKIGLAMGGIHALGSGLLDIFPRAIRDAGYRFVARHRKEIAVNECLVPTEKTKALFIYDWADVSHQANL